MLLLPKSYILTRSGFFQEFGAVSRTNVLRKPLYCAAGSLARIWWQEHSAKSDNREGNFLREEEILESLRVKKAALTVLVDLLPGCVYTVAADLCLQPCRKEPLLKTNGITFQRSWCQVLESRATFDNFTQFNPADLPQVREDCGKCVPPLGFISGMLVQFLGNQTLLPTGLRQQCKVFSGLILNMVSVSALPTYHRLYCHRIFFLMHPNF